MWHVIIFSRALVSRKAHKTRLSDHEYDDVPHEELWSSGHLSGATEARVQEGRATEAQYDLMGVWRHNRSPSTVESRRWRSCWQFCSRRWRTCGDAILVHSRSSWRRSCASLNRFPPTPTLLFVARWPTSPSGPVHSTGIYINLCASQGHTYTKHKIQHNNRLVFRWKANQ